MPNPEPVLLTLPLRRGHAAGVQTAPAWGIEELAGRLVELSGPGDSAVLTLAFGLVLDAQHRDEPAAWVTTPQHTFFPPDVASGGVDLDALLVVRVPDPAAAARAADRLVRSGAFGLVIVDLGPDARAPLPLPLVARLGGLAQKHHSAIVFLTRGNEGASSLGSLVSLRAVARRRRIAAGRFRCEVHVAKDKRRGPTWRHAEECCGPPGLR